MNVVFVFRPLDDSTEGFHNWEFMTTHSWGEQAAGEWTLSILDTPSDRRTTSEPGLLVNISVLLPVKVL